MSCETGGGRPIDERREQVRTLAFALSVLLACSSKDAVSSAGLTAQAAAPSSASVASASVAATVAATAPSPWMRDATDFEPFMTGLAPVCGRDTSLLYDPQLRAWSKVYTQRLPAVAPAALEAHLRAKAKARHLDVKEIGSLLSVTDESRGVVVSLQGPMLRVAAMKLPSLDLDAELQSIVSQDPSGLVGLIRELGGAGSLLELRRSDGEAASYAAAELKRGTLSTQAVADAAKKAKLLSIEEGLFASSLDTPPPGSWKISLAVSADKITILAAKAGAADPPACADHPARSTSGEGTPADPASDELLQELLGE